MKIIVNSFLLVIKNESRDFSEQDNSIDFWNTENEWGSDKQSSRTEEAVAKENMNLLWKTTEARVAKSKSIRGIHGKVFI